MEYINMTLIRFFKILKTVLLGLCVVGFGVGTITTVFASPSSKVVWDSETRHLIKNANIKRGEKLTKKCSKCHGKDGADVTPIEVEDTPFLVGQIAHANYKQMVDYQDKKRDDTNMFKRLRKFSKQDLADISAYYASQVAPVSSVASDKVTAAAIKMVTRGAGERFLPPCAGCHGLKGEGSIVDVPALAGQNTSYFITTMLAYRDDERENDIYSRMRFIAKELSEKEITELADYYASIGTGTEILKIEEE